MRHRQDHDFRWFHAIQHRIGKSVNEPTTNLMVDYRPAFGISGNVNEG